MKKVILTLTFLVFCSKVFADCRLPLVGDIQVAMNLRVTLDEKIGKEKVH